MVDERVGKLINWRWEENPTAYSLIFAILNDDTFWFYSNINENIVYSDCRLDDLDNKLYDIVDEIPK